LVQRGNAGNQQPKPGGTTGASETRESNRQALHWSGFIPRVGETGGKVHEKKRGGGGTTLTWGAWGGGKIGNLRCPLNHSKDFRKGMDGGAQKIWKKKGVGQWGSGGGFARGGTIGPFFFREWAKKKEKQCRPTKVTLHGDGFEKGWKPKEKVGQCGGGFKVPKIPKGGRVGGNICVWLKKRAYKNSRRDWGKSAGMPNPP